MQRMPNGENNNVRGGGICFESGDSEVQMERLGLAEF